MQNLVRATGRAMWYLADPVEDNANHTWTDYRENYHATLVASLLQADVAQYEITPWPERVFGIPGRDDVEKPGHGVPIPPLYAQELQTVFRALKDMQQPSSSFQRMGARAPAVGLAVSDSLMFQRGGPIVDWVRKGGTLVFVDDDGDAFHAVREWWNEEGGRKYATPREHLFEALGVLNATGNTTRSRLLENFKLRKSLPWTTTNGTGTSLPTHHPVGNGLVVHLPSSPTTLAFSPSGSQDLWAVLLAATPNTTWTPAAYHGLRQGPYLAIAGMDETPDAAPAAETLHGTFVDLFDPLLAMQTAVPLGPASRHLLVDLDLFTGEVVPCAGEVRDVVSDENGWEATVEGASGTPGVLLLRLGSRVEVKEAMVDRQR